MVAIGLRRKARIGAHERSQHPTGIVAEDPRHRRLAIVVRSFVEIYTPILYQPPFSPLNGALKDTSPKSNYLGASSARERLEQQAACVSGVVQMVM